MAGRVAKVTETYPWLVWDEGGRIIGYAYSVNYLRGFSSVNGIGVLALAGLTILVITLAALSPSGTWLTVFLSPSAGGRALTWMDSFESCGASVRSTRTVAVVSTFVAAETMHLCEEGRVFQRDRE